MQIADKAGDPWAGMWIRDHKSNKCDLSMPKWFLAKDGFSVEGKEAVEFEEVAIRPCFLASIARKIGKDSGRKSALSRQTPAQAAKLG